MIAGLWAVVCAQPSLRRLTNMSVLVAIVNLRRDLTELMVVLAPGAAACASAGLTAVQQTVITSSKAQGVNRPRCLQVMIDSGGYGGSGSS